MERIITLLVGLSLAAASPSVAQINQKATSRTTDSSVLLANAAKHPKERILSVKVTPSVGKYLKAAKTEGQVEELLNEDFSLMATGITVVPGLMQTIWKDSEVCPCGWQNLKEGYTHMPLWGCEYVYPAGGAAYLLTDARKTATHASTHPCSIAKTTTTLPTWSPTHAPRRALPSTTSTRNLPKPTTWAKHGETAEGG